jgi:hypothetical protein
MKEETDAERKFIKYHLKQHKSAGAKARTQVYFLIPHLYHYTFQNQQMVPCTNAPQPTMGYIL